MQLRRIKEVDLIQVSHTKRANGTLEDSYTKLSSYKIIPQELQDQVSASIYGANIDKTLRISSIRNELETLLKGKLNNDSDNISNYLIQYDSNLYKIVSVRTKWIDIELKNEKISRIV